MALTGGWMSVRSRRFGLVAVGLAFSVVASALPQHLTSAAARAPQASAAASAKRAANARPTVKAAKPDPEPLAGRVKASSSADAGLTSGVRSGQSGDLGIARSTSTDSADDRDEHHVVGGCRRLWPYAPTRASAQGAVVERDAELARRRCSRCGPAVSLAQWDEASDSS